MAVDWPILTQILIEEGMETERIAKLKICFTDYRRTRSSKQRFWDLLFHGSGLAGTWWEGGMSATIYTDQHRTLKEASRTLAHEMGHALDKAPGNGSRLMAWTVYLALFLAGGLIWTLVPLSYGEGSLLVRLIEAGINLIVSMEVFILTTVFIWWPLQKWLLYRNRNAERSARDWEERLTSRKDWEGVLRFRKGSAGS